MTSETAQPNASHFDLIVIGGGITGAGVFRLAAENNLRVLLLEHGDFASGTSSKSSKLIHGGLRYLRQLNFKLTREACTERNHLLTHNPQFIQYLPFYFPIYRHQSPNRLTLKMGLSLYDWVAASSNVKRHTYINRDDFLKRYPAIKKEGLKGAYQYYDTSVDDARLVIETIKTGVRFGGVAQNYASIRSFCFDNESKNQKVIGLTYDHNGQSHTAYAQHIINATGIHTDDVRNLASNRYRYHTLVKSSGIHLVLRKRDFPIEHTLTLISPIDERPLFIIDWHDYLLFGTTDVEDTTCDPFGVVSAQQAQYLIDSFNHYFPSTPLSAEAIVSKFCGIRPLIKPKGYTNDPNKVSREHGIFVDHTGLISVTGGKLTTFRLMAMAVLQKIVPTLSLKESHYIFGRPYGDLSALVAGLSRFKHLAISSFGASLTQIEGLTHQTTDDEFLALIVPYTIHKEWCTSITDFLTRRFRLALWSDDFGISHIETIKKGFQDAMGINDRTVNTMHESYLDHIKKYYNIARP